MRKNYTEAFKEEVIRASRKAASPEAVRKQYKLPSSTFYNWLRSKSQVQSPCAGLSTQDRTTYLRHKKDAGNGKAVTKAILETVVDKPKIKTKPNGINGHAKATPPASPAQPTKDERIAAVPKQLWAITYVDPYQAHIVEKFDKEQDALDRAAVLSMMGVGHVHLWSSISFETLISGRRL
jgi:transposase-like protein